MSNKNVCLVVLGAGASWDCLTTAPVDSQRMILPHLKAWPRQPDWREIELRDFWPPLTVHLVQPGPLRDLVLERYPLARPIVAELRDGQTTVGFEERLKQIVEDMDDELADARRISFQFYLRDLMLIAARCIASPLGGVVANAYTTLLTRLWKWARKTDRHVCVVTFNYDPLVDYAYRDLTGCDLRGPLKMCEDPHLSLLRPHGSALWYYQMIHTSLDTPLGWRDEVDPLLESATAAVILSKTGGLRIADTFSTIGPDWHVELGREAWARGVPALALPLADKAGFVWPTSHDAHFQTLTGRVERIITIGWQAGENHFRRELQTMAGTRKLKRGIVGGRNAEADAELVASRIATLCEHMYCEIGGFSNAVKSDVIEQALSDL